MRYQFCYQFCYLAANSFTTATGQERLAALRGWEGGRALSVTFFAVLLVDLAMSLDAAYKNPVVVL